MDTDTEGLYSATTCNRDEVILLEAQSDEWRSLANGDAAAIERRVASIVGSLDFRVPRFLRADGGATYSPGQSFLDFKRSYVFPTAVYSCVCCSVGEAMEMGRLTIKEFLDRGGRITTTRPLSLKEE